MRLPLSAVQSPRSQQCANHHQRYPQGQIEARAERGLGFNGICLDDKDIHEPNCHSQADPTQHEAHEHRDRPPVPYQKQVNDQQLRVQCREASEHNKRRGHSLPRESDLICL